MISPDVHDTDDLSFGHRLSVHKMPAHWLMARLGKRILRPGGIEMTRWLLDHARIDGSDDVVEMAPGLGVTAMGILERRPNSYVGIERDRSAGEFAERALRRGGLVGARIIVGDAGHVPLAAGCASVIVGEAMLSMQPVHKKRAIVSEATRLLRPGGRYAIHELCVAPDDIDPGLLEQIQRDLSRSIHVGVRIGTRAGWARLLEEAGLRVEAVTTAPMHLLEARRLVSDEGAAGAARFVLNAVRTPGAAARLLHLRGVFRAHGRHLSAVALVARRTAPRGPPVRDP